MQWKQIRTPTRVGGSRREAESRWFKIIDGIILGLFNACDFIPFFAKKRRDVFFETTEIKWIRRNCVEQNVQMDGGDWSADVDGLCRRRNPD